jgi:hypothetical protein
LDPLFRWFDAEVTPLTIPNRAVKLGRSDGTRKGRVASRRNKGPKLHKTRLFFGGFCCYYKTIKSNIIFMQYLSFIAFIVTCFYVPSINKGIEKGKISQDPLTKKEKVITWILCILCPVINGAIFYYGLKKKFPVKAKKANTISIISFLIEFIILGLLVISIGSASR